MKLIDLNSKTKFYTINNGKVVAARFKSAVIRMGNQYDFEGHHSLDCRLIGELELADGTIAPVNWPTVIVSNGILAKKLYTRVSDALDDINPVVFTITHYEFMHLMLKLGAKPTPSDVKGWGGGHTRQYKLWAFDTDDQSFGAKKAAIQAVDLLTGTITTELGDQWYNTKEECECSRTYELVDFPDDEPEEEEEEPLHIVFIEVIK